jgi:hypothetical protein
MLQKQHIVSLLVVLFFFSFVGAAAAESRVDINEFSFETYEDKSISGYVYDQEMLELVGTEGGIWEYNPNAKETKADRAARDYNYDESQLSKVGTEGGVWEFTFDSPENAICGSC